MNQPITRQQHGVSDFLYSPLVAAAPALAGFTEEKTATELAYVLSGTLLASTLTTRAEWGLFKLVPFKAHLAADTVLGVAAAAAPWLFGFADNKRARNAFLAIGAVGLMAGLLSRPEEMSLLDELDELD